VRRDDPCIAGKECFGRCPRPEGGEPRRISWPAICTKRRSNCREFVANHAPLGGGAVPPLARARTDRTTGAGKDISNTAARFVFPVRCQRFARLCVLMNPILPGSRSIRTWPAIAPPNSGDAVNASYTLLSRSGNLRADAKGKAVIPLSSQTGACAHSWPHPAQGT